MLYALVCWAIGTVLYFNIDGVLGLFSHSVLPLSLLAYMTINFHHYVVDAIIWRRPASGARAAAGARVAADGETRPRLALVAMLVTSCLLYAFYDRFWYPPDEGNYAHVAERILDGEILNLQVQDIHPGYISFVNAAALRRVWPRPRQPAVSARLGGAGAGGRPSSLPPRGALACGGRQPSR